MDNSTFVDEDHSVGDWVSACNHGEKVGELLSGELRTRGDLVHVEVSSFGHHEELSELRAVVQKHWEVCLVNLDLGFLFKPVGVCASDVHDVKCLVSLTFLSLAEAEQVVLGVDIIGHGDAGKAGSVSIEKLLLLPLYVVELDLALDVAVGALVDSNQEEPFPS